jgi:valyl-tRNA synthetase
MYYFKYKIFNSKLDDLIVATTRPETMFTDVALVINPNNKKFSSYKNKFAINPINNEKLKIYFSDKIEEDFGTGVMKCTPAHDFFDYDIAKELKITKYESCINLDGKLSKYAKLKDADFSGMDRLVAREKIVAYLKKKKMFVKEEKHTSNVGFSERSNEVVEPLLSLQ